MAKKDFALLQYNLELEKFIPTITKSNPKAVGQNVLIQRIVKNLLTKKRSNTYEPLVGSPLANLIGVVDKNYASQIQDSLPVLLEDLVTQLKEQQAKDLANGLSIADEEYLENITINNIEFDEIFGGWLIELLVITKANTIKFSL